MIYIDASRCSNTAQKTGVENYSYFLISELAFLAPDKITLISPHKINLDVPQIIIPFRRLWTQIRLSCAILRNKKIDNLFIPSHVMPIIHPKNTVITIHDVAFKRYPESYGILSRLYLNWGTKFAVKHARRIIVPSVTTKRDLIKFYKADSDKIIVIPLGYKNQGLRTKDYQSAPAGRAGELSQVTTAYNLQPTTYFLFIGRIETKKNIRTLIKAFEEICKEHPNIKLVLAGKPGIGGEDIIKTCHKIQNIVITGYIGEDEKWSLLKHCLCFVFPSLFEGFGIPLLEAMAANVPIIASKIPTSYEIAKNNALFFEPHDTQALINNMEQIIKNTDLRKKLTKYHSETLKTYSWKNCAKKTLEVLKE